jgi:hypothetical protein
LVEVVVATIPMLLDMMAAAVEVVVVLAVRKN